MNKIVKIMIERDGMTEAEARRHYEDVRSDFMNYIDHASIEDLEDVMMDEFGLELDYIEDFLF